MEQNQRQETRLLSALGILPVTWLALLTAPHFGKGLPSLLVGFAESVSHPFRIVWCANSLRCVLLFLLAYALILLFAGASRTASREGEEHGSARWGDPKALDRALSQKQNFLLTKRVRLGMDTHLHRRNLNILILGGSGAGKTRTMALPNILQANCSFVVTDPKGEILSNVGHFLKESGYVIRVFNLVEPSQSDGYNPFRYIRDDKDVLKLITNLIRNTTPKGSSSGDPFWEKSETALLEALMFYLIYEAPEEEQNFAMIMTMLSYADVREDRDDYVSPLDLLFRQLERSKPGHIAVKQYSTFKLAAGKTAKSILVSVAVRLAAFNLSQIRDITSRDNMDFGQLGEQKTAVFAVIPDNDTSMSYLVGMLYTQIIQELYYRADHIHHGRLPVHVRLILDEFANVSLPEAFDKSLATMRSREISSTIIIQNLAQLKGLYKEHGWETITGNCDTLLYLGGNEQSTHEYISKMLGKGTILSKSHTESKGKSGSFSTQNSRIARDLLTPDEVRLLDNKNALLFIRGFPAVQDEKYDLTRHPNYKRTAGGGCPPYLHRERLFASLPFERAFDFTKADQYILLEEEEHQ